MSTSPHPLSLGTDNGWLADACAEMLGQLDSVMWQADPRSGRVCSLAGPVEAILGYPAEHWLGDGARWERAIHPADRDRVLTESRTMIRRGVPHVLRYRMIAADGRQVQVEHRAGRRSGDRLHGLLVDVSGRYGVEVDLHRQTVRLQAELLDAVGEAVIATGLDGRITYWNRAAERLYGWAAEEVMGRPILEITPNEASAAQGEEIMARLAAGESWTGEFMVRRRDGESFPARVTDTPVRGADGELVGVVGISRDLSEAKAAEAERERLIEELELERGRLHGVFQDAPAYICVLRGPEHVFEMANPLYRELTGGRELIGRPAREACPELEGPLLDRLDEVYRTGQPYVGKEIAVPFEGPDGRLRQRVLDFVYQPMTGVDGSVRGVFAHGVDVTEARAARAKLAAAEAHYRRLVENSPYPIYALDAEGIVRELNSAALEAIGYSADEIIGRHFREIIHPSDVRAAMASFERTLAQGRGEAEIRLVRRDGEPRLIHLRAAVIEENGAVVGTQGVARDVTDERARDERMRLLATALEGLDKGVSIIDSTGRFLYANSAHAALYGYELDRLGEMNAVDLVAGPDAERDFEALIERVREGSVAGRFTRRRADGTEVAVGVVTGRMEESGRELFVTITHDVSDEVLREQHMHRAERLASMGTLLSGVAHELNNPLNAIANFAQLLLLDERPEQDQEALEIMRREAERAAKIVLDLRVIARQTQDERVEKAVVDLNDVVRHALKLRRYRLETHDIEVVEALAPALPPVWASRPELEQVVLNLVLNAEQAMLAHGPRRRLAIRTSAGRSRVVVQISDTGPGIPRELVDRIFDPFFTTKSPGEGTGLGLSLAHTIVAEHGGEIRVASSPRGTTFTVELPSARLRTAPAERDPELDPPERPLRVLAVDDESSLLRSIQIYLERRGHRVALAGNGAEALDRVEGAGGDFDVILSDLRMPGLGGEELLRRLRLRGDGVDRRVIFMTGDAASSSAARILADTGHPALIKPVKLDELARVVEEADRRLREEAAG